MTMQELCIGKIARASCPSELSCRWVETTTSRTVRSIPHDELHRSFSDAQRCYMMEDRLPIPSAMAFDSNYSVCLIMASMGRGSSEFTLLPTERAASP